MGAIDAEQPEIGRRHDRGGSGLAIQQAHLTEEVTRLELAAGSDWRSHRGHAVDDDEEGIARVSNPGDHASFRDLDDPRELLDSTELVLVEPAEQRNSLEMSSVRIAGGHGLARVCLHGLVRIMEGQAIGGVQLHSSLQRSPVSFEWLAPARFNQIVPRKQGPPQYPQPLTTCGREWYARTTHRGRWIGAALLVHWIVRRGPTHLFREVGAGATGAVIGLGSAWFSLSSTP